VIDLKKSGVLLDRSGRGDTFEISEKTFGYLERVLRDRVGTVKRQEIEGIMGPNAFPMALITTITRNPKHIRDNDLF
jgi:hypothetical protein